MSAIIVPESWENFEDVMVENKPLVKPTANPLKKGKKLKKYPEMAEHCPKLRKILVGCETADQVQYFLEIYLEAVVVWKPKKAEVGKREIANKKIENEQYQHVYSNWLENMETLGLRENSTIGERQTIQTILEKYTKEKFQRIKFQFMPQNSSGII
jgi:hypothetical protein